MVKAFESGELILVCAGLRLRPARQRFCTIIAVDQRHDLRYPDARAHV